MVKATHNLDGYFTRLARTFAKDHGVEVIVRGNESPRADLTHRKIYLPATADYATGEGREALEGLLDHEAAHVEQEVLAEQTGRPGYVACAKMASNGRERLWLNVYEDVRIEELWAARWAGVAKNLEAKARHSMRTAGEFYRSGRADPHWALGCGVIARARGFGHLCDWLPPDVEAILARLQPEIEDARRQQGPQDALALARRTLDKIGEIASGGDPAAGDVDLGDDEGSDGPDWGDSSPAPGGASDAEDNEPADAPDAGDDAGADEADGGDSADGVPDAGPAPGGSDEGEGEPATDDGESGDDGEGESGEGEGEGEGEPLPDLDAKARRTAALLMGTAPRCEDPLAEVAKTLKVLAEAAAMADPRRVLAHPEAARWDQVHVPAEDPYRYRVAADVALPAVNALATRLAIWLRAQADRTLPDQLSGQIDGSALASLVTGGDRRIFEQTERARDVRTAVTVLVDESGSMGMARKVECAREAAVGLGWTLQRCGIAFEILGWTDEQVGGLTYLGTPYTRVEAQQIYAYKAFHEHFPRVCKRLGSIRDRSNNDDSSAILTAARRLAQRPEPRKILLVLSDGLPCHAGYAPDVQLHHVIAQVRAAGIEVGGVGICSDHVRMFYAPHVVVVHRPADLAVRVVELFKSLCQSRPGACRAA